MSGLNVSGKPVGDFNFELIKADVEWLSRDLDSLLEIILQKDINGLRNAFLNDRFSPPGQFLQRIQYLTCFLKVPYRNKAFTIPQKVFPQAGKEQRSVFVLNLATITIFAFASAEYDIENLGELNALVRDINHFFLPDADTSRFHWFHSAHVDLLTNIFVTTLIFFSIPDPARKGDDKPNILIDRILEKVFGSYVVFPLFQQRKKDIHYLIKSRIYEKNLGLDATIRLLIKAYPYSQFMETLWKFIQKCYHHINAHPILGKYASALYDNKSSEVSNFRERKRRKISHHSEVDSEDEIKLLTYPKNASDVFAMNQISAAHSQSEDGFSLRERVESQDKPEIISSRQLYSTNTKSCKFYPKPAKFLAQFGVTMVDSENVFPDVESTYDEQIDSILNASGVKDNLLCVTDNGDLEWSSKSQISAESTTKLSHFYYPRNRKRSMIWKATTPYIPKVPDKNFNQMAPDLLKLLINNKSLIKTTENPISQKSFTDIKNSAFNDVNTTDLSSKNEKGIRNTPQASSSVTSKITPILNTPVITQYPAGTNSNFETQNHSSIINNNVQQDKGYFIFSFASVNAYFNNNRESLGQTYNGTLQDFTGLFLKNLNQPLGLIDWIYKTSFNISVPQYLVSDINHQQHVYESYLLTQLKDDSSQFFLQFVLSNPTLRGSQYYLVRRFDELKKEMPISRIKKYTMATVSLFLALSTIGARLYYNSNPSTEYFRYAEYFFRGMVLNYNKDELTFIMDKAFMQFCERVISEVQVNLQQSVPLGPQPENPLPSLFKSPAEYHPLIQNNNGSHMSYSVSQAPTSGFIQASIQAPPFRYSTQQHSHMQNMAFQCPSLESMTVKSAPSQAVSLSPLQQLDQIFQIPPQQPSQRYEISPNANASNQTSIDPVFSKLSLEVASKTNQVMNYNIVINTLNVIAKSYSNPSNVSNVKHFISFFLHAFNAEYQKRVPGSLQWSPFNAQKQGKNYQKVDVNLKEIKVLLTIYFKVAPSNDSLNRLQPNPTPVRHVNSKTVKQSQTQSSSTSFQKGSLTDSSSSQKPVSGQPSQLSNESKSVTNPPLSYIMNELSRKDLTKEEVRLYEQTAQLNIQLKTNTYSPALVKPANSSSNTTPPTTNSSSTLSLFPNSAPVSDTYQKASSNLFTHQSSSYMEKIHKILVNYVPFRVAVKNLVSNHGLRLSDVENKMVRFRSLSILIAESVVNCITKLEPTPEEFNILQKTVLKTSKEVVDTLSHKQLEQYLRKEENTGISIQQLLNSLPKGNVVNLTLLSLIPGKSDTYDEKEINLISRIWLPTAKFIDRMVRLRYSTFKNSNSAAPVGSNMIKKESRSTSVNSVEQKISKDMDKTTNQIQKYSVHDITPEASALSTERPPLDKTSAANSVMKSANIHSTPKERDTASVVDSVAPQKIIGLSEKLTTTASNISPPIKSPAFMPINTTQQAARSDSTHSTKADSSQISTSSGTGSFTGNSKHSPNPVSNNSSAFNGEVVTSKPELGKGDTSKPHFIDTLLLLDISENENELEHRGDLFENSDSDPESDIEEITSSSKIQAFKKISGKDIVKSGSNPTESSHK